MEKVEKETPEFLRVGEAADYVGVTPQTLRRWDADGKLTAIRRPGSKYRYYRQADLEPFRLQYAQATAVTTELAPVFANSEFNIEANELLREPQREAHQYVREHFEHEKEPAILQIPVGCGKTGIIATLPFGVARGRVLVITPNLTIRRGVAEALDISSRECFLAKTQVLRDFSSGPYVAVLDGKDANIHDCMESHVVVTNIQQLASSADRWLPQFPPDFFDLILVDEGHHAAAESWQKVFRRFPNAKVVGLTATPFRADQRQLPGDVVYRYPFARAMVNGFIKQIHARNVAPSEVYFTMDGDTTRYTLDEVLELREEQWFRRGVALSPECNRHIAEASIHKCNALRAETGIHHQVIAAACSVDHARQVRSIYEECGYRAAEIHSDMSSEEQEEVLSKLLLNQLDCVVQVNMLGEGFDHPRLSVAAVFRPFRSLGPYVQFVGRVMRVVIEGNSDHPDNQGHVISHVGLNNEERWEEFRELDLDDQDMIHEWLSAEPEDEPTEPGEPTGRRRFDLDALVDTELVSHFVDKAFLDPDDDRVLDELLGREIAPGITLADVVDREDFRAKLREKLKSQDEKPAPIPVSPQRQRVAARKRLNERERAVARGVLDDLNLPSKGRQISIALGMRRDENLRTLFRLVFAETNSYLGIDSKQRDKISKDQAKDAYLQLDSFGDAIRDKIALAIREANNGENT